MGIAQMRSACYLVAWVLNSVTKYLRDAFDGATVSHLPSLAWGDELCAVESRNRFV
jgi:hypothetical protein